MSQITYSRHDRVGTIVMGRGPANGIDISFVRDFDAAIEAAERDTDCLVVVVRSNLSGFFSGGGDVNRFRENAPQQNTEMIAFLHETLSKLTQSEKIYIAEIDGHALGGGYEIALACDLRFASTGNYRIGLPEVKLGLFPAAGGTQRLASLIGPARALEFMITGTTVTAEEALQIGLITRLFTEAELTEQTLAYAKQMASAATPAISKIKRSIYDGFCSQLSVGFAMERRHIATLFASEDVATRLTAFIERKNLSSANR
jgi:enoyl-CoA hydratase/carnithine racemase